MLFSLALVFLCGLSLGGIFKKIKLPSLLGMLITGIILGPGVLNLLDEKILLISGELRQVALIVILTRAGLALDIKDLKKVGRPAFLLCFVPACFEIIGMICIAPKLLGVSILDATIMGTVIAAVSPAVIVPKMLKLMETRYGTEKSIPQMIMAGASIDDVFVIVLFTVFTGLAKSGNVSAISLVKIPTSILFGLIGGIVCGYVLNLLFKRVHIRDSAKVIVIISVSFLLVTLENNIYGVVGFSGLLAVMSMGATIQKKNYVLSKRLSSKFSKIWVFAEVLLFVLVGATVDMKYVKTAGVMAVITLLLVLLVRMLGVYVCLLKTKLTQKERLFCMFAYIPKATVQAAIGSIPLSMGLPCGNIVLTIAVLAILITAPLGAVLVDVSYKKLLQYNEIGSQDENGIENG